MEHAAELDAEHILDWHVAQKVLLKMFEQPISISKAPSGDARFIDPRSLTERVLKLRSEIADRWIVAMHNVPESHLNLQRQRLMQRVPNVELDIE